MTMLSRIAALPLFALYSTTVTSIFKQVVLGTASTERIQRTYNQRHSAANAHGPHDKTSLIFCRIVSPALYDTVRCHEAVERGISTVLPVHLTIDAPVMERCINDILARYGPVWKPT